MFDECFSIFQKAGQLDRQRLTNRNSIVHCKARHMQACSVAKYSMPKVYKYQLMDQDLDDSKIGNRTARTARNVKYKAHPAYLADFCAKL